MSTTDNKNREIAILWDQINLLTALLCDSRKDQIEFNELGSDEQVLKASKSTDMSDYANPSDELGVLLAWCDAASSLAY